MMPTWLAGLVAVAAITVTYVCCVRPHLRRRASAAPGRGTHDRELDSHVTELRAELRAMRAQNSQDSDRVPSSTPNCRPHSDHRN